MPGFCFAKQWLDPDSPLAHRLLVRLGCVVAPDALEIGFIEAPPDHPSPVTLGALGLERAAVTGGCICSVDDYPLRIFCVLPAQGGSIRTAIVVLRFIIDEGVFAKERRPFVIVGQRQVGTYPCVLYRYNVLGGAIGGVTRDLPQGQLPPKATVPEQIQHRLVIHDFRGCYQGREDDSCFPAVHGIVRVVTHIGSTAFLCIKVASTSVVLTQMSACRR